MNKSVSGNPQSVNEKVMIWRYLDFAKFMSLLDKQALFFSRADKLSDQFEGSWTRINLEEYSASFKNYSKVGEENLDFLRNIRKYTIVNCWHWNEYESAAMWKLYNNSDEGIAIQSNLDSLIKELKKIEIDGVLQIFDVKYIDFESFSMPKGDLTAPFFHKRKSFAHEQEIRAVIQQLPFNKSGQLDLTIKPHESGINIPVDLNMLIKKILVSPTAPQWFMDLVCAVIKKYNLDKPVIQSSLAEPSLL